MMDDALLAGERAKAKKPDNWDIVGKPQSQEAYGCMLRKDDPQFKKLMMMTLSLRCRLPVKRKNGLINGSKIQFRRKT